MRLIELYRMLPIQTDTALDSDAMYRFQTLAMEYELSAHDAYYLGWLNAEVWHLPHWINIFIRPPAKQG